MNVLVTGGAGYIGSHTVVALLQRGHSVTIVDNFSNSQSNVLQAIHRITGLEPTCYDLDVRDSQALTKIMQDNQIDSVIHFAAFKAVGESVALPLKYYDNNLIGLISVLEAMNQSKVNKLIFSSSATVYGDPDSVPITEAFTLKTATNPYGATKQIGERIIQDTAQSTELNAVILRYFNPIGAHESGLIGELPQGTPNNLVPYLVQAAAGVRDKLTVFGNDYDTPDGTGVRDYIHVVDLAEAHVAALLALSSQENSTAVFNIGTGNGVSVLELIQSFEKATGVKVPYEIGPRRPGDIASCYADATKANKELNWKAARSLDQALTDAWRWQTTLANQ